MNKVTKNLAEAIYMYMLVKQMSFVFYHNQLLTREDCLKIMNREGK